MIFTIWLIGAILGAALFAYMSGRTNDAEVLSVGIPISLFWPVVLVIVVVFTPFLGLMLLGEKHRKQKKENQ